MMYYNDTIEYSDSESEQLDYSDCENSYVEDCGKEYGCVCYDNKIIQNEKYKIEDYLEADRHTVIPYIRKNRVLPSDSDMYDEYKQFIKFDDAAIIIQHYIRNFLHKKRIQDEHESNELMYKFKLKTISLWKHNYNSNKGILKLDENIDDLFECVLTQKALEETEKSKYTTEIARTNQLKWRLTCRRKRNVRYNKNIQRKNLSKYLVKTVLTRYLDCKDLSNIIILYCVSSKKCWYD